MKSLDNIGDRMIFIGVFILFPIICYALSSIGDIFIWLLLSAVVTVVILTFAAPLILVCFIVLELFATCFSALFNRQD